jgi:hypothetical protein
MEGIGNKRKRKTYSDMDKQFKLGLFLDSIIHTIDPFTTNDIEIPLTKMLKFSNQQLTEADCHSIYSEFILSAETCNIPKISDLKKDFNLNWSKEEVSSFKGRL